MRRHHRRFLVPTLELVPPRFAIFHLPVFRAEEGVNYPAVAAQAEPGGAVAARVSLEVGAEEEQEEEVAGAGALVVEGQVRARSARMTGERMWVVMGREFVAEGEGQAGPSGHRGRELCASSS